jgi:flagellar hook-associated protein 1 FlgK
MSISGIFNAGVKGMAATQLATQVSANNISNAATVGYTRRTTIIQPNQALIGGVSSQRVSEPFIERRLLNARSASAEASAERTSLGVLDQIFAEGDGSIGTAMDSFQVAMQNLTARPEDSASRQQVLSSANALSLAFGNASAQLKTASADANSRVTEGLNQVNQRLHQIARLGAEIQQSEVNGVEASDLRDQRALLVSEVSDRVPVTVIEQDNGQMNLLLGGSQQLVSADGKVSELSTGVASDGAVSIQLVAAGARTDVTGLVSSGSVGGAIKAREGALKEAHQRLDRLAFEVAEKYNEVHAQGYGLDGEKDRMLFEPLDSVVGAAEQFVVSSDVAGSPEKIGAASSNLMLPSDNRNALALSALSSAPFTTGGLSVTEALASLVGFAGSAIQNATQNESFATGALEQVQALRDDVSGVSTDEEMVNMMKYQRAYQASLKVIQVADEMLNDLLNIRG